MARSEFVEWIVDRLADVAPARSRAMFGGHGIYLHDVIVGIAVDDVLYLKVDDATRPAFEAAGSRPFTYHYPGKEAAVMMGYWEVPAAVLDDDAALASWAEQAHGVALRAAARPGKQTGAKKRTPA